MKRSGIAILGALAAISLLGVPSASAETEVGWRCVANDSEANWTLLASGSSGIPIQPNVVSEGVITSWRVEVEPGLKTLAQRLEVFQVQNELEEYKKLAESALEMVGPGTNTFTTRIPVTEGNSIGLYGPVETFECKEETAISKLFKGSVAVGETQVIKAEPKVGTPVTAMVEPDRDYDGYGDETQDRCPQSAIYQTDCPTVTVSATGKARARSILVEVSTSSAAPVVVFGQVGWGFTPKPKTKAASSKRNKRIVGLSGGAQTVIPGQVTRFTIPLPKTVLRRLNRITPSESLNAKITVRATDVASRPSNDLLTVKLKGRDNS